MSGLTATSAYVPRARLERRLIVEALGAGKGKGSRAVASYDEDTTTLAVEAARGLVSRWSESVPDVLYFCTGDPAYLEKSNATVVHAALGLPSTTAAYDLHGSVRSAVGAFRAALDASTSGRAALLVLSDMRSGRPGSADESTGADAGVAMTFSPAGAQVVELLGAASATAEFIDRWRVPGQPHARVWEERFGESVYVPLATEAVTQVLKQVSLSIGEIDHLIVVGLHERAVGRIKKLPGIAPGALADEVSQQIGNSGVAAFGLELCAVLERARPGERIMIVAVADGADALVLEVTGEVARKRPSTSILDQVSRGNRAISYTTFLTWRGALVREPPRRPEPVKPSSPSSHRTAGWKFAFTGSACNECGTRHLPPSRVCQKCHAVDEMTPVRLADSVARVATFTIDHLAYSPSPPFLAAVVDFDGGGRYPCELTDVLPDDIAIGQAFEMTFRCLYTADGIRNYFWKARPALAPKSSNEEVVAP